MKKPLEDGSPSSNKPVWTPQPQLSVFSLHYVEATVCESLFVSLASRACATVLGQSRCHGCRTSGAPGTANHGAWWAIDRTKSKKLQCVCSEYGKTYSNCFQFDGKYTTVSNVFSSFPIHSSSIPLKMPIIYLDSGTCQKIEDVWIYMNRSSWPLIWNNPMIGRLAPLILVPKYSIGWGTHIPCWWLNIWRFPKSWRYPQIIQTMEDHVTIETHGALGIPHCKKPPTSISNGVLYQYPMGQMQCAMSSWGSRYLGLSIIFRTWPFLGGRTTVPDTPKYPKISKYQIDDDYWLFDRYTLWSFTQLWKPWPIYRWLSSKHIQTWWCSIAMFNNQRCHISMISEYYI